MQSKKEIVDFLPLDLPAGRQVTRQGRVSTRERYPIILRFVVLDVVSGADPGAYFFVGCVACVLIPLGGIMTRI